MEKPLVSVIIPSYGRPAFLAESVRSVIEQDYPRLEIIVVDDNGRDQDHQRATHELIELLRSDAVAHHKQLKYVVHEVNLGGAAARNTGVESAAGTLIALLDNDDTCMPDRISKQVNHLLQQNQVNPNVKASLCLPIRMKHSKEIDREIAKFKSNFLFELLAIRLNLQIGSAILLYKSAYAALGGFDPEFRRNQDVEFMIRFYDRWDAAMLNEHLIIAHIDDRSNIPNYQKIVETKQLLLSKYADIIGRFDISQQKEIYKSHALEVAKVALWNKNIGGFFKGLYQARLGFRETVFFFRDVAKKAIMHLR